MHVLITGGAGFIGSHLVEYHLKANDVVHVLDDLSTGTIANLASFTESPNLKFIHGDIVTYPQLKTVVNWADRIYHMAAVVGVLRVIKDSEKLLAVNIEGTERLLRAAKLSLRQPRILLASSSEVYGGEHTEALKETDNLIIGQERKCCTPYSVSKITLEYFGLAYFEQFKLPVTMLRLFNTVGPRQVGQYGMVVPRFIRAAVNNEPIDVYGTGEQTRSFCDVRDTVIMLDKIANNKETVGEILNVGLDQEISINDLAVLVKKIANSNSSIKHTSYKEAYGEDYEDILYRKPDLTKLQGFINYKHKWTLQETIADLVAKAHDQ